MYYGIKYVLFLKLSFAPSYLILTGEDLILLCYTIVTSCKLKIIVHKSAINLKFSSLVFQTFVDVINFLSAAFKL